MNLRNIILPLATAAIVLQASALNSITTTTESGRIVTVTALNDNILKVTNAPVGAVIPDSRTLLTPKYNEEISNVRVSTYGPNKVIEAGISQPIIATLDDRSGSLMISLPHGATIYDNGKRQTSGSTNSVTLAVPEGAVWRGGGERGHSLNLAGDTLVMYNRPTYGYGAGDPRISQMNITMPLVYSSDGYALVFDDYAAAKLILGDKVEYITESSAPITYYVVASGDGDMMDVQENLAQIIGTQPAAPLWTLGYITSKYGYKTNEETRSVVDRLKAEGYPLDGIVLDLYWYGKEQDMGRLDWDPQQWGDYRQMLADLKAEHVNLLSISQPYVLRNGRGIDNYNFLAENAMLVPDSVGRPGEVRIWVGEGGMLDVSNPATRSWLADRYSSMRRDGVAGMWGDLGEPEMHPDSLIHFNGLPARLYHNIYGNDWASIITEMMARDYPSERFMTLMRGGTIGLQRQSVFPWSGDVSRSWGGLQAQIPIMINSSLSGLPYMHHDVGGFAVDPENPVDEELYIRWLQLGLFSPILRTHAQEMAEPYNYPQHKDIILPLIRDRYRWLPYNYSIALRQAQYGESFVNPVDYVIKGAPEITDQYMWGNDVMVAPVIEQGAASRTIVFPGNELWYDLNNPAVTYTDTIVDYKAPLDVIPHFAVGGAVIPTADYPMQSTADYRTDRYTISIYPMANGDAVGHFMTDDLTTPSTASDYTDKAHVTAIFLIGDVLKVQNAQNSEFTFHLYGQSKKPRAIVAEDGKKVKFSYDKATGCVTFTAKVASTAAFTIRR